MWASSEEPLVFGSFVSLKDEESDEPGASASASHGGSQGDGSHTAPTSGAPGPPAPPAPPPVQPAPPAPAPAAAWQQRRNWGTVFEGPASSSGAASGLHFKLMSPER